MYECTHTPSQTHCCNITYGCPTDQILRSRETWHIWGGRIFRNMVKPSTHVNSGRTAKEWHWSHNWSLRHFAHFSSHTCCRYLRCHGSKATHVAYSSTQMEWCIIDKHFLALNICDKNCSRLRGCGSKIITETQKSLVERLLLQKLANKIHKSDNPDLV